MTPELLDLLQAAGVAAAVLTAVAAFRKSRPEAGKLDAETDLIRVEAQAKVIDSLQDELGRAQEYIRNLKQEKDAEIAELRTTVYRLQRQVISLQTKERTDP